MKMADKPAPKAAAKPVAKGKSYSVYKLFDAKGGALKRLRKSCPKCGQGFFLAEHKSRISCGKCHYTEFLKK